jgi:23S rRNA (adenine2503-C2)-methyltransferase
MVKEILCGKTADDIFQVINAFGFNKSHATLIAGNIYRKGIGEFSQFQGIPRELRRILASVTSAGIFLPVQSEVSVDKTIKYLFRNIEGKQFETVYIPDKKRHTVCVSTQSGCRMGCPFCVTGSYGFYGNLSAGEIVNQVISLPDAGRITHVVFMGMGEPMDNLGNVLKACSIITSEWGMAISPRNVTISTVGITTGIKVFLEQSDCNIAVSLFSPFADERSRIIPAERKYPVREIIEILRNYPVIKKRRFSIAYVMIKDVNDTDRHLDELKAMLGGSNIRVNLLPYHPVKGDPNVSSSDERMFYFKHNLVISGISASIRTSRGADISAACGLLASGLKGIKMDT